MAKRMSDNDVMDYVYGKLFGDLDGLESKALFDSDDMGATQGTAPNAMPASENSGGVKITVQPLMAAAQESGKALDTDDEEEDDDDLKGISNMSPLMAQLHGAR